jgi:hypothetical protein
VEIWGGIKDSRAYTPRRLSGFLRWHLFLVLDWGCGLVVQGRRLLVFVCWRAAALFLRCLRTASRSVGGTNDRGNAILAVCWFYSKGIYLGSVIIPMGLAFFCYDDELMLLIPDLDPHSIAPVMFAKILCESRSVIFSRFALFTNSDSPNDARKGCHVLLYTATAPLKTR